jgi:hypothetical protein
MTAQLVTSEGSGLQEELRELLASRVGVRRQLLELDRIRLQNRLERLDQQISELTTESDATVERELGNLLRMARRNTTQE